MTDSPSSDADPIASQPLVSEELVLAPPASALYRIGPSDRLSVQVVGHPEFGATLEVTRRHTILMPILGEIDVRGITVEQLQAELTRIIDTDYLASPQVLVQMSIYNNMKVWVFGHVDEPGEIRLRGPTKLTQILSRVRLSKTAGRTLKIERRSPVARPVEGATADIGDGTAQETETETISVDLDALLRDGDLALNVVLRDGDKIYVPGSSAKVYAFGQVSKPGFYPYREGMKVADLIQLAGGFSEFANQKKVKIRRRGLDKEIRVNLKNYYNKGELDQNILLDDGDTIIIGSSFFF